MILRKIFSVSRKIHKLIQESIKETGIGSGQVFILIAILNNNGINQEYLCRKLDLDKSTVTKGIKFLLREKYLLRVRDKNDRRNWLLFPTKKGENIHTFLLEKIKSANNKVLNKFTENEKTVLQDLLEKIDKNS